MAVNRVSQEFIRHTVIEETGKLLSRRCFDTGFVPYLSIGSLASSFGTIKLFGAPLLSTKLVR